MNTCAFMVGIRNPVISPSPILGLAKLVAFLNPSQWRNWQHEPLATKVGEPFVYNVPDFTNVTDIVAKAEAAVEHRFASFVRKDFQVEEVVDCVCTMLKSIIIEQFLCWRKWKKSFAIDGTPRRGQF